MARQKNDGKGRLGGRAKGTPNKVTSSVKDWIVKVINDNREQMEADLTTLEPKERLQILEKLMSYVVPKQQALNTNIDFAMLSDEDLDILVNKLTKDIDDGYSDR